MKMMQWMIIEDIEKNLDKYSCDLIVALALKNAPKKNITWYEISDWVKKTYDEELIVKIYGKIYKEIRLYSYYFPENDGEYWDNRREILSDYGDIFHRASNIEMCDKEVKKIINENPEFERSTEFDEECPI